MAKVPPQMWEKPEDVPPGEDEPEGVVDDIVGHSQAEDHEGHDHGPGCGHEAEEHDDHVDYLHDGERHFPHEGHWDSHPA